MGGGLRGDIAKRWHPASAEVERVAGGRKIRSPAASVKIPPEDENGVARVVFIGKGDEVDGRSLKEGNLQVAEDVDPPLALFAPHGIIANRMTRQWVRGHIEGIVVKIDLGDGEIVGFPVKATSVALAAE